MSTGLPCKRPATEMENCSTAIADTTTGSPRKVPGGAYKPSIFNENVFDDLVLYIGKKISKYITLPNLEIEAKFGVFASKQTQRRIEMNALTETVIPDYSMKQYFFKTTMTPDEHRCFNQMLNELVQATQTPNYRGERVHYKHTKEVDEFVEQQTRARYGCRLRVSRDQKTGELLPKGMVKKTRIADINIHSPGCSFDCRISINQETQMSKMPKGRIDFKRFKDRISYSYSNVKFDLTQVKESPDDPEPKHELELEFVNLSLLRVHYDNDRHSYLRAIESFINDFRAVNQRTR